mmetsp:Transcript_42324/g.99406  ORF Transcript_42324/g.99406 Transcript_42324/m.99406 type:complete len:245 (+) Transcript_42324:2980-3714(+)
MSCRSRPARLRSQARRASSGSHQAEKPKMKSRPSDNQAPRLPTRLPTSSRSPLLLKAASRRSWVPRANTSNPSASAVNASQSGVRSSRDAAEGGAALRAGAWRRLGLAEAAGSLAAPSPPSREPRGKLMPSLCPGAPRRSAGQRERLQSWVRRSLMTTEPFSSVSMTPRSSRSFITRLTISREAPTTLAMSWRDTLPRISLMPFSSSAMSSSVRATRPYTSSSASDSICRSALRSRATRPRRMP